MMNGQRHLDPMADLRQHERRRLDLTTAGQQRQASETIRRYGEPQPRKRPRVAGSTVVDIVQRLLTVEHMAGRIVDETSVDDPTQPGDPPSVRTVDTATLSQSVADTSNTTNTVTYQTACQRDFTLPPGTWTLYGIGGLQLKHSAGGSADWRLTIGVDVGSNRTRAVSATAWETVVDNHESAGHVALANVKVQYKSNTAGTTSAQNPWFIVVAVRTTE